MSIMIFCRTQVTPLEKGHAKNTELVLLFFQSIPVYPQGDMQFIPEFRLEDRNGDQKATERRKLEIDTTQRDTLELQTFLSFPSPESKLYIAFLGVQIVRKYELQMNPENK